MASSDDDQHDRNMQRNCAKRNCFTTQLLSLYLFWEEKLSVATNRQFSPLMSAQRNVWNFKVADFSDVNKSDKVFRNHKY
jgi:hypothetical protein